VTLAGVVASIVSRSQSQIVVVAGSTASAVNGVVETVATGMYSSLSYGSFQYNGASAARGGCA
jgi:hypothetical protein